MSETTNFFAVQIALLAIVLIMHTYMGLHVIRRTIIFCDLVLGQLAAFGALIGIGLGIGYASPGSYLLAMAAVLFGSLLLALINPRNRLIPREAVIGIMYALSLVACLLLGDKLSGGSAYITKTLAGSLLWVNWTLVSITAVVYILLLLFHFRYRRKFISLTENPEELQNSGLWDFLFFLTQGIITVLIVPIAGVLLAYSFLMIPSAIAAMFSKGWAGAVVLGWSVGLLACLLGLLASFFLNLPYGPTLVLSLGIFFLGAVLIRAIRSHTT
jgi:zinc/manganese transport system permease protein